MGVFRNALLLRLARPVNPPRSIRLLMNGGGCGETKHLTAGIIGNEILSGSTKDSSSNFLCRRLHHRDVTVKKVILECPEQFELDGNRITPDKMWNIAPNILNLLQRRLLFEAGNPLNLIKQRIVDHFNSSYRTPSLRSPLFAVCENEPRLVHTFDNFDSLLIPSDHPSRKPSDTYYANAHRCLRAHTSAHQFNLLKQGLNNFLVIGDVYRRDQVDRTHYPCFHQVEGVRTYSSCELFGEEINLENSFKLFLDNQTDHRRDDTKQAAHTIEASRQLVIYLQHTLEALCKALFGADISMRWVNAYFPFTHPSFELEVFYEGEWLEVLGCGIIEQSLLDSAGAGSKVGWAFGLGLERLAMILYGIPDIRLFWSKDTGFLNQFSMLRPDQVVKYKAISIYPQLIMDLSFWLPPKHTIDIDDEDMKSDVQDTIRSIGGDLIEQANYEKKNRSSHCYRIIYRSMERVLVKAEVNKIHKEVEQNLTNRFGVEIR